jgi:hypothetical protein
MKKARKLVVDGREYLWRYTHSHPDGVCQDQLSVHPQGGGASLRVRFVSGEGGSTTTGEGWGGHAGGLLVGGQPYNLNQPGLIVRIMRAALERGWGEQARGEFVLDGFELLRDADIQPCD